MDDRNQLARPLRLRKTAIAFNKRTLPEERVLTGETAHATYLAVADRSLSTGYVYANPAGIDVTPTSNGYRMEEETYTADELSRTRTGLRCDVVCMGWTLLSDQICQID